MSTWRTEHQPHCPLNGEEVDMDLCQPCRFFRGAALESGKKAWTVNCNWPRDGAYISEAPDGLVRTQTPDVFSRAFQGDGE